MTIEMIISEGGKVMSFEIAEMIFAVAVFPAGKQGQHLVNESIVDIPVVGAVTTDCVQRIRQLESLVDEVSGKQRREGCISPAVAADVDDEILHVLLFHLCKAVPEEAPEMIAVFEGIQGQVCSMADAVQ